MAKHVRVGLQLKAEATTGRTVDHPGKSGRRDRRAALAYEDDGHKDVMTANGMVRPYSCLTSE